MQLEAQPRSFDPRSIAAERRLFHALRDARFIGGHDFVRAQELGAFVVDFCCERAGVVVEIEGARHDRKRPARAPPHGALERSGLVVLRFSVDDVLFRFAGVRAAIIATCNARMRARVGREPPSQ